MTPHPTGPTLAELIAERKGDRSYARLAEDCNNYPTRKRLQQLAVKPLMTFPDPDTIRGLGLGLGSSVTDVVLACARSIGLPVAGSDPSELCIAGAGELPPASQELLLGLARDLLKVHHGGA